MIEALGASPIVRATGQALVEFAWQGALVGAATWLALVALRRSSAQARYVVACAGLVLMCVAPVVTASRALRGARVVPSADQSAVPGVSITDDVAVVASPEAEQAGRAGSLIDWWTRTRVSLNARLPLVVLTWFAGVLALAIHFAGGWIRLWRIRRTAVPLAPGRIAVAAEAVAARLGVHRRFRLLQSARVSVPAVVGWIRPAILMPTSMLAGIPAAHLEAILAHELAHIRRGDFLVNILQCSAELLLFYHPAVWWVSGQIRVEREFCTDDAAVAVSGDRVSYARALASLETLRAGTPALAMGASDDLLTRVRRLVAPDVAVIPRRPGGFAMSIVVILVTFALTGGSIATSAPVDPIATLQTLPPAPAASTTPPTAPPPAARAATTTAPARRGKASAFFNQGDGKAQTGRSVVTGTVRDKDGGVLPGVTVTIAAVPAARSAAPLARQIITNARGVFVFDSLPPGEYELTAALPGFRTNRSRLQVRPDARESVMVRLELGVLSEAVVVRSGMGAPDPTAFRRAGPQTAADCLDLAKVYYQQGRLVEAEELTLRAVELMRAETPRATVGQVAETAGVIRVGGDIDTPKKIRDVKPTYPADAAAAGTEGMVIIEATIGRDGAVTNARVIKGVTGLDEAALAAVRQWLYMPTRLNGVPVEVVMTVSVTFVR